MRVLIVGNRGQLGRDLMKVFSQAHETAGFDLPDLDITQAQPVRQAVEDFVPDVVINAAAYTDVERAEDDPATVFLVNETGAGNVAAAAESVGAAVVYFSTDYVFDGTARRPYEPGDPIAPLGVYGRSKAAGETATCRANTRAFIVRTAWLYGPGGNNFVEKILHAAERQPRLRVVCDETGSPTHTLDLAEATRALCETRSYGVFHAVNAGECSRLELARAILELAGKSTPVHSCISGEFPAKAARPAYSAMSANRLAEVAGYTMRPWRDALAHYIGRRGEAS